MIFRILVILLIFFIVFIAVSDCEYEKFSPDLEYYKPTQSFTNETNYENKALLALFPPESYMMRQVIDQVYPYSGEYFGAGYFMPGSNLEGGTGGGRIRLLGQEFSEPIQGRNMSLYNISLAEQRKLNMREKNM